MVVRKQKRNRKYLGTRRWGVGNIKNARGAGGRGGIGEVNRLRKHDWTYITAKRRDLMKQKGFAPRKRKHLEEITLDRINAMGKSAVDLPNCKVLSNGALNKPVIVKAAAFSKTAAEKIKGAGGQAITIEQKKAAAPAAAQAKQA